jgi:arsenite methyltransferase
MMPTMLQFDERTARHVEAVYMTPDVIEQRRAFRALLDAQPGEAVIDVGSGPGILAAELAAEVGTEGRVVGVDPSESMLAMSHRRELAAGAARPEWVAGDALALPVQDASFDAAVSTQVLEYVDDVPAALAEIARVLRPGGRVLILDTDWDSIVWHSRDPGRMRRVLEAWNEHLADPFLPRRLPGLLEAARLRVEDLTVIPLLNRGFDPNTYSAGLLEIIAPFVAGRQGIEEAEATAWLEDLKDLGDDYFLSVNRYVVLARAARPSR